MSYYVKKQIRAQDRPLLKTCWVFLFQKFNLCVKQSHREVDKGCEALEQSLQILLFIIIFISEHCICKVVTA